MGYITDYETVIGKILLASDGEAITGLWFYGQKYFGATLDEVQSEKDLPVFRMAKEWLDQYFQGKNPKRRFPIAPKGSEFRQEIWKILLEIPYGRVTTYGVIAKKVAEAKGRKTMSAQAVGGAVGHNPISVMIPCHRVVGTNGKLTGYAGGVEKKEWMLALERSCFSYSVIVNWT